MADSNIEWTDKTWNPVAGCEAVSPGCAHCYAATMTRRLEAMGQQDYAGLTTAKHFNGKVRTLPDKLGIPLKWRKPRRVFVNSMSDLFHEDVPDEFINSVFAVMGFANKHTYQILTKRAERMHQYMTTPDRHAFVSEAARLLIGGGEPMWLNRWPLECVWLGVSCEDQQRADERIPWLLKTPAAVRFLSCEPLLGPIDLGLRNWAQLGRDDCRLDWVIVGGESGHGARPCDIAWVRSIVEDCKAAGVACFVKQLGSRPVRTSGCRLDVRDYLHGNGEEVPLPVRLKDKKGGDIVEFPADLRVRQYPQSVHA